jgi:CDP-glucose 4,6-dehydratase
VDLLRSFEMGEETPIRYPDAVRPWQHVLDCLNGYLVLADALLVGRGTGEWNIGPGRESFVSVGSVADRAAQMWGDGAGWRNDSDEHPHEANLLALDATKVSTELGWHNKLPFPASLEWTIDWQKAVAGGADPLAITKRQLASFEELA